MAETLVQTHKVKKVFSEQDVPAIFKEEGQVSRMANDFLRAPSCSASALATFLLVFSARKQEAHSLALDANDMLVGSLQKRGAGQAQAFPITSCIDTDRCKKILRLWRSFPAEDITASIRKLEAKCKQLGFGSCSVLRETGAWLASKDEQDPDKKKALHTQALRGAGPKPKKPPSLKRRMVEAFGALETADQEQLLDIAQKKVKQ